MQLVLPASARAETVRPVPGRVQPGGQGGAQGGAYKDGLQPAAKGSVPGKDKTCCGYPLVADGEWALRFYWMADQEKFDLDHDENDLYTRDGLFIGSFPERFIAALNMEGTARLSDGRVLNYHGRCRYGTGTCYETLDPEQHPYGRGAGQRALVPFKSVAIDPRMVPIGEPLYIAEFDGLLLPDGSVHDGCVRADDTGGNIKQRKMDFFVESSENWRAISRNLLGTVWMTPQIEHPRCRYLLEDR